MLKRLLLLATIVLPLIISFSCEKNNPERDGDTGHNDTIPHDTIPNDTIPTSQDERLIEATYFYYQPFGTTLTRFRYQDERLTGYTSWCINNFNGDTLEIYNTEIEYSGDSVVFPTYKTLVQQAFSFRTVRTFANDLITTNKEYFCEDCNPVIETFEYNGNRYVRHRGKNAVIDSVFYNENGSPDHILSYSGPEFNIVDKKVFVYEADKISFMIDSACQQGVYTFKHKYPYTYKPNGMLDTFEEDIFKKQYFYNESGHVTSVHFGDYKSPGDSISFKYEPGKGNTDILFQNQIEKVYGLPHVIYPW